MNPLCPLVSFGGRREHLHVVRGSRRLHHLGPRFASLWYFGCRRRAAVDALLRMDNLLGGRLPIPLEGVGGFDHLWVSQRIRELLRG